MRKASVVLIVLTCLALGSTATADITWDWTITQDPSVSMITNGLPSLLARGTFTTNTLPAPSLTLPDVSPLEWKNINVGSFIVTELNPVVASLLNVPIPEYNLSPAYLAWADSSRWYFSQVPANSLAGGGAIWQKSEGGFIFKFDQPGLAWIAPPNYFATQGIASITPRPVPAPGALILAFTGIVSVAKLRRRKTI